MEGVEEERRRKTKKRKMKGRHRDMCVRVSLSQPFNHTLKLPNN